MTNEELKSIRQMLNNNDDETFNLGLMMFYTSLENYEIDLLSILFGAVGFRSTSNFEDANLKLLDNILEEPSIENLALAIKITYILFDNPYLDHFCSTTRQVKSIYTNKIIHYITEENQDEISNLLPDAVRDWWESSTQNFFENERELNAIFDLARS